MIHFAITPEKYWLLIKSELTSDPSNSQISGISFQVIPVPVETVPQSPIRNQRNGANNKFTTFG